MPSLFLLLHLAAFLSKPNFETEQIESKEAERKEGVKGRMDVSGRSGELVGVCVCVCEGGCGWEEVLRTDEGLGGLGLMYVRN